MTLEQHHEQIIKANRLFGNGLMLWYNFSIGYTQDSVIDRFILGMIADKGDKES